MISSTIRMATGESDANFAYETYTRYRDSRHGLPGINGMIANARVQNCLSYRINTDRGTVVWIVNTDRGTVVWIVIHVDQPLTRIFLIELWSRS
jgi:hypothetical protein